MKRFNPMRAGAILAAALWIAASTPGQIQLSKPKPEEALPNPMIVPASRDEVRAIVRQMLETKGIPFDKDDCDAQTGECAILSKPLVFIKGITTKSQLEHYCEVPAADVRNWSKGRYTLRIQISPASPKTAQVGIYARFEGLVEDTIGSQWIPLSSKGELEDQLMRCLNQRIRGEECKSDSK